MKIFKTLKGKIVVCSLLVSMIGFVCFSIINTSIVQKRVSALILDKTIQETKQIGKQAEILLAHDATVDELQSFVESQVNDNKDTIAYAIVIDKTVTAVAHSDAEKIGKNYADDPYTVDAAVNGKIMNSQFYADVQKAWTYDIMVPITVNGEFYGAMDVGIYENYISGFISQLRILAVVSVALIMLAVVIAMLVVCNILFKSFHILVEKCNEMGEGDFTNPLDGGMLKRSDEIGVMGQALNQMRMNLQRLIRETMEQTDNIVKVSESITEKSSATDQLAKQIAVGMQRTSEEGEKQDQLIDDSSIMMGQINDGMESVAANMQNVSESSTTTVDSAHKGYEIVEDMIRQMNRISEEVNHTSEKIQILSKKSTEIESVVGFITGIASQTNLLALNASIEAARAGEQGKGFAVVAGEVGNLAEQSSKAANEIVELIKEVQSSTVDSIESMTGSKDSIVQGLQLAEEAGTSFKGILSQITAMSEDFTNISAVTEEVTASSNNLLTAIEELSSISKGAAKIREEAAEAMQEQSVNMEAVQEATSDLSEMSGRLEEQIKVFKL